MKAMKAVVLLCGLFLMSLAGYGQTYEYEGSLKTGDWVYISATGNIVDAANDTLTFRVLDTHSRGECAYSIHAFGDLVSGTANASVNLYLSPVYNPAQDADWIDLSVSTTVADAVWGSAKYTEAADASVNYISQPRIIIDGGDGGAATQSLNYTVVLIIEKR